MGCRRSHEFKVDFSPANFYEWEHDELLEITLEWPHKLPKKESYTTRSKTAHIPILYAQLIAQLLAEDDHGDNDNGHESLRRQAYAREVLDAFGREIRRYKGEGIHFHSTVLNPILQRYRQGVPDAYAPLFVTPSWATGDRPSTRPLSSTSQWIRLSWHGHWNTAGTSSIFLKQDGTFESFWGR